MAFNSYGVVLFCFYCIFVVCLLVKVLWYTKNSGEALGVFNELTLLSFNIDGLNFHHRSLRTSYVVNFISEYRPDVVHLQEIVPETFLVFANAFEKYGYTYSQDMSDVNSYFTISAVKLDRFSKVSFLIEDFSNDGISDQGRYLLKTVAVLDNLYPILLINFHLESMGPPFRSIQSITRMHQLREGINQLFHHDGLCLISGDLNLRDEEAYKVLRECKDRSKVVLDVSEILHPNNPPHTFYRPFNSTSTARYDRIYIKQFSVESPFLRPLSLELIGDQPIITDDSKAPYRTPSDHRGLFSVFSVCATFSCKPENEESK